MQSEELRRALFEMEAAHARYFQLFDLAPIAYVTLDRDGFITEANFAAGVLLRENRRKLIGRRLSAFIDSSSADAYTLRLREVLEGVDLRQLELDLATPPIPVRFTYNAIRKTEPTEEILGVRLAIIDLTELRDTRASLVRERHQLEAIRALAGGSVRELGDLFTSVNSHLDITLDYLETTSSVRPYLEEIRRFIDGGDAIVRKLQALEHGALLDVPVR